MHARLDRGAVRMLTQTQRLSRVLQNQFAREPTENLPVSPKVARGALIGEVQH
jgi:hypothetical protein